MYLNCAATPLIVMYVSSVFCVSHSKVLCRGVEVRDSVKSTSVSIVAGLFIYSIRALNMLNVHVPHV